MEFRHIFQRITKVLRITETIIEYYFFVSSVQDKDF